MQVFKGPYRNKESKHMLKKGMGKLGLAALAAAMLPMTANAFIFLDPWNLKVNKQIRDEVHYHGSQSNRYLGHSLDVQKNIYNNQYTNNVTNNYYDGNIVLPPGGGDPIGPPIPTEQLAAYQAMFRSYDDLAKKNGELGSQAVQSRAINNNVTGINTSVMQAIDSQAESMGREYTYNNNLARGAAEAQQQGGNAAQLQYANAIALETNRQLMRMRSLMLATETANNARAQAASETQAQQLVSSKRLTEGVAPMTVSTSSVSW